MIFLLNFRIFFVCFVLCYINMLHYTTVIMDYYFQNLFSIVNELDENKLDKCVLAYELALVNIFEIQFNNFL